MEQAIAATVPSCQERWEDALFQFAVRAKANPALAGLEAEETVFLARAWHKAGGKATSGVKLGDVRTALVRAWKKVCWPQSRGPLQVLAEEAIERPLSSINVGFRPSGYAHLATLCFLLHKATGNGLFFLACRTVAEQFEVSRQTAAKWLRDLVSQGLLSVKDKPNRFQGKATVYAWTGPVPDDSPVPNESQPSDEIPW